MRTSPYHPNEANVPPAGVLRKERLTSSGSKAGNSLGSQLLSRSSLDDGNYACGPTEVSDDDLITAAQRGGSDGIVALWGDNPTAESGP